MAQRPRLSSMSDHSSPSSDTSENSESFDAPDLRLNLETSLSSEVTESERQQIESFFAGLGTEVSIRLNRRTHRHCSDRKWSWVTFFSRKWIFCITCSAALNGISSNNQQTRCNKNANLSWLAVKLKIIKKVDLLCKVWLVSWACVKKNHLTCCAGGISN